MLFDFTNRVALITGSSEGIGLAVAKQIAEQRGKVVLNGRSTEKLERALNSFNEEQHDNILCIQGDVTHSEFRNELVEKTVAHWGKVDILVNNAGGGINPRPLEQITDEEWEYTFDLNLKSAFALCREVIPFMKNNNYGRIVNVSSLAGRFKGRLSGIDYSASKAGLQGFTRHIAYDLAPLGITANAVAPGFVLTERALKKWDSRSLHEKELHLSQIPMNRFGTPEEIAAAIIFLASNESSYITGITMDINGGSYML